MKKTKFQRDGYIGSEMIHMMFKRYKQYDKVNVKKWVRMISTIFKMVASFEERESGRVHRELHQI